MSRVHIIRLTDDSAGIGGGLPGPPPSSDVEPLFDDDFESYAVGTEDQNGSALWTPGNGDGVFISTDQAHSGTRSLRFRFAESPGHIWAEQRFSFGQVLGEFWMEYWFHIPDNYFHREQNPDNNKFIYFWDSGPYTGGPAGQVNAMLSAEKRGTADGISDLDFMWSNENTTVGGAAPEPSWSDAFGPADAGWHQLRYHVAVASSSSANDGVFEFWWDGTLRISAYDIPLWDSSDNGFQNGYLLGYDNSGFAEQTDFHIDEVKVYDTDPGWT